MTSTPSPSSTPLIPAQAGIHSFCQRWTPSFACIHGRGDGVSGVIGRSLSCVAIIRAIVTPINIVVIFSRLAYRRLACGVISKVNTITPIWRMRAIVCLMYLMFTSSLLVFVYAIFSHLALHNKEAGLTNESINDSKKFSCLFSAPTSGLLQNLEMSESPRVQPWRFVFPNVTVNADSHFTLSPHLKRKRFPFCSKKRIGWGKLFVQGVVS